jgi:hypothetical protein
MLSRPAIHLREHVMHKFSLNVSLADEHREEQLDHWEVENLCEHPDQELQ